MCIMEEGEKASHPNVWKVSLEETSKQIICE